MTVNHAADVAESEGTTDSLRAQPGVFDTDSSNEADERSDATPAAPALLKNSRRDSEECSESAGLVLMQDIARQAGVAAVVLV